MLRHLAEAGHEVTLVSFVRQTDRQESIQHLRGFCYDVHTVSVTRSRFKDLWFWVRSLTQEKPFLVARDWVPAMSSLVSDLLQG